jgi:flagellar hook protein FlgE
MVAGTTIDFEQGPLEINDQPALLALDGEGLFILEGESGERLYARDGQFTLSTRGELLARGGYKVLGFGVTEDGSLDTSKLVPLQIRLGSHVADEHGQAVTLHSFAVQRDGRILGRYSDGRYRPLGQLRLVRFPNQAGLTQRAGNAFRASPASGLPRESNPGEDGAAQILPGATELSNVDLARELTKLQLAENQFRANLFVLHTADSLLDSLFFPWRIR